MRILALGRRAGSSWPPLPVTLLTIDVVVGAEHFDGEDLHVRRLARSQPTSRQEAVRAIAGWVKTTWLARRYDAPAAWLWTLKGSRWLRQELPRRDVVVSLDPATDRALTAAPALLRNVPWLSSTEFTEVCADLGMVDTLLTDIVEAAGEKLSRDDLDTHIRSWSARMQGIDLASMGPLQPVQAVARTARALLGSWGPPHTSPVVIEVLDDPRWDVGLRAHSGLLAHRMMADTWAARGQERPTQESLVEAVDVTLSSAEEARHGARSEQSLDLHTDAMALLFHRELHAEVSRSPLVDAPGEYLRALWDSPVHRALVEGPERTPVNRVRISGRRRPRVLILTGAYGEFHHPVASALRPVAKVRGFRAVSRGNRLWQRFTTPGVLASLAHLGADPQHAWPGLPAMEEAEAAVVTRLREALVGTDVVFTDWADRSSVVVSHILPEGVRMVLRVHSLDALDPWFHLMRWPAVDQVIVTSEPLRSLVCDLLLTAGARTPVVVLPNLVNMHTFDQPKLPDARHTLGLVGWGRRVKDPLWALDLLAREPSWRLRLIGPDFGEQTSAATADYVETVRSRLTDPSIKDRVDVVGRTDDVAAELAHVGVILSSSRRENFHLGLVEGVASGAVPVVRDWPLWASRGGAGSLFPTDWVVADLDEAEARVRAVTSPEEWLEQGHLAQTQVTDFFDPTDAARGYRQAILPGHADVQR